MAKVIDYQEGEVSTDSGGNFTINFPHPFSGGYVIEIFSMTRNIGLKCLERGQARYRGHARKVDETTAVAHSNHNHAIARSACAAGHANCITDSPTGTPSATVNVLSPAALFNATLYWRALGT